MPAMDTGDSTDWEGEAPAEPWAANSRADDCGIVLSLRLSITITSTAALSTSTVIS